MQLTLLKGYPDAIGRRKLVVGFGTGPTSYVGGVAGGDALTGLPFQWYSDCLLNGPIISVSGNFVAIAQYSGVGGRQTIKLRYFAFAATSPAIGAEVSNTTNLSAEKFQVALLGGLY
jgi:hypothetical protein